MTGLRLVLARDLERELAGLGPGIAKEHGVGKGVVDKALRQPVLARDLKQVRSVPQALGLLGHSVDEVRVAVAETGHPDAAGKVEKLASVGRPQIEALAPVDDDIPPAISRHYS